MTRMQTRRTVARTVVAFGTLVGAFLATRAQGTGTLSPPAVTSQPQTIAELERRLRFVLDSAQVPGMGLAIVRGDSVVYAGGLGKARLVPAQAATDRTLFRIGSTSKAFVALTVMALAREGKLSLEDRLADRLPGFPYRNPWEATDPIRIKHLLEHTTGWDDNSLMSYAWNDPALSLEQALRGDSLTHVARWRPGTRFSYCNTGPGVAALIIEQVEGKPFEQVVQERWFTPIGMATATYFFPDTARTPMASLYAGTPPVPQRYWHLFARPAGAINASAHDMAAYVRFLLGRGTVAGRALLAREDLERMERHETSAAARAGLAPGYGLHLWRAADTTGFIWRKHDGGVNGGLSDLSYLPEHGVGYAFQINSGNGLAMRELARAVRGFLTANLTPLTPEPAVAAVPAASRTFAGWYRPVSPRVERLYGLDRILGLRRITVGDAGLTVSPLIGEALRYVAVDSLRFRRPGEREATLALVRDEANGRPLGVEDAAGGLPTSLAKAATFEALGTVTVAMLFAAGIALSFLAMLWGGGRRLVARLRRRPLSPAPARAAWRWLALLGAVVTAWVALFSKGMADVLDLGNRNGLTVALWGLGWGYLALSVVALWRGWRWDGAEGRWPRLSQGVARVLLAVSVTSAAYLTWWGLIGWRTWAG